MGAKISNGSGVSFEKKDIISFLGAFVVFGIVVTFVPAAWDIKAAFGIIGLGTVLWVTKPLPLSMTAILVVLLLVGSNAVPLNVTLSGFSTGSLFLVLAGLMMAQGVNATNLGKRMALTILVRFGKSPASALWGLFLALEILAFAVPATAVRTLLLLPTVIAIIDSVDSEEGPSNVKKLFLFGLCFGVNITGAGILPGALANVMTAEMVSNLTGVSFGYYKWLLYAFPISILLIPLTIMILLWVFPTDIKKFNPQIFKDKLDELGAVDWKEKRCGLVLIITILLWLSEPLHGWHPAVPAIVATLLMSFPGIGFIQWEELLCINWGTVLLLGTALSLGTVLNETGGAEYIASIFLRIDGLSGIFAVPVLGAAAVALLTIIYHLGVGHVTTVVATLIPVVVEICTNIGVNPVLYGFVVGISSLFGFILVIETLPNIIVYNSGYLHPLDWIKPGFWISLAALFVISIVAWLWWPLVGLV